MPSASHGPVPLAVRTWHWEVWLDQYREAGFSWAIQFQSHFAAYVRTRMWRRTRGTISDRRIGD